MILKIFIFYYSSVYTFSLNPFCTVSLSSYNTFHSVQCSNNGSNLLNVCLYAPLFDSEFIIIKKWCSHYKSVFYVYCRQFILHHHLQHPYHCQCSFLIIRINFIVHSRSPHQHHLIGSTIPIATMHSASNISGAAISLSSSSSPNQEHFVSFSAIFLFVVCCLIWSLAAFIHVCAMFVMVLAMCVRMTLWKIIIKIAVDDYFTL